MGERIAIDGGLSLRESTELDRAFLRVVFGQSRQPELALVDWDDATRTTFLDQQFLAQQTDYRSRHPDGRYLVVEDGRGVPIGLLYLADLGGDLRVLDVALLEEHRGRGYGTALLGWVIAQADDAGSRTSLHVERWNPAQRLYERLGFATVAADDINLRMEREPTVS